MCGLYSTVVYLTEIDNPLAHFSPPPYYSPRVKPLLHSGKPRSSTGNSVFGGGGRGGKRTAYLSPSGANPLSHCISGTLQHVLGNVEARQLSSLAEHLVK